MCRVSGHSVYTTHRLWGRLSPDQSKLVLPLRKISRTKNARNFNFLSSNCWVPIFVDEDDGDEGDKFPCAVFFLNIQSVRESTAQSYSSIPSNARSFFCLTCWLRRMVLYSCWSLPYIRHVISCILFSLEQSRIVHKRLPRHHPDSIFQTNVPNFEFSQLSVATCE